MNFKDLTSARYLTSYIYIEGERELLLFLVLVNTVTAVATATYPVWTNNELRGFSPNFTEV